MLQLHNTLTKKKEEFKPIHAGKVSMYICGPTVYDYLHLGNVRSYMTPDILRRYLEYSGYEVRQIKNITDVGHLTQDDLAQGDSGEDKIEKKALKEKKSPREIADYYEAYFHDKEKELNILPAHYFPKATAHVGQMIKIIQKLIDNGSAYEKNGNVFFDVTSFPDYGKLSGNTLENLKVGARLEEHPDKKNPWDFALWLKAPKEHILKWDSPWSLGYPGWHIECSAMSTEYLGDTIDIHTGGEDNIFPHHEAEIAQTECATGAKFVNYWLHTRHLLIDGEKMSKSKGNFYTLENIKEKGYDPMVLRLAIISSHYRNQMNFTWDVMDQARSNFQKITDFVLNMKNMAQLETEPSDAGFLAEIEKYQEKFEEAMDDDLNTPLALSVVYGLITETNKLLSEDKLSSVEADKALKLWEKMNKIFGLIIPEEIEIPEEVKKIAEERKQAREAKDFQKSDELRDKISELGYTVEDIKDNNYLIKRK
ncbi:MAG TPA: cysteine--tRNA ligase [Candidatus Moranbacteria bacterium]|nr:cysteine--tRNA ligase [Candidatus Moranbacteria bacterium]